MRFSREGYDVTKPLVPIAGRPMLFWLLDNLRLRRGDVVFMALDRRVHAEHGLEKKLRAGYEGVDFRFTLLGFETRGAAETLYTMLQEMTGIELARR